MAKIGIYTDTHLCEFKSVINKKSKNSRYSDRLDSVIDSFKWMYDTFKDRDVDIIIDGGDLLDRSSLNSIEITSLVESYKNSYGVEEYHIVGNHETLDNTSKISSMNVLSLFSDQTNHKVIDSITLINRGTYNLLLIPFIPDFNNLELVEILSSLDNSIPTVAVSHNYYLGINYGPFEVTDGIDFSILDKYDIPIFNGHIHNSIDIGNYHQVGSFMGSSFNDIYDVSKPCILIYDTDTKELERISNPYTHLFYKLDFKDIKSLDHELDRISTGNNPLIIRVSANIESRDSIRTYLSSVSDKYNIYYSEIISVGSKTLTVVDDDTPEDLSVDSYEVAVDKLSKYILSIDDSKLPDSSSNVIKYIKNKVVN